jgi:ATP synthase protein I
MTATDCYAPDAMAQQDPARDEFSSGDPWHAFGYLVSGVGLYGLIGWLADRWLGTSFLVAVGIVVGAVFGVYLTWSRFKPDPDPAPPAPSPTTPMTQEKQ